MKLVMLAKASDVSDGSPLAVQVVGFPPLAVYQVGERFFVTDNLCTHGHALLSEGYQDGCAIECPFHGGKFDIETGAAILFPCQIPLKTYVPIVQDGCIYIAAQS